MTPTPALADKILPMLEVLSNLQTETSVSNYGGKQMKNILVGVGHARQSSGLGDQSGRVCVHVVPLYNKAINLGVELSYYGEVDVGEGVAFDKQLRAHAAVDTGGGDISVDAVVHMSGAKADRGRPGVDVVPAIIINVI